MTIEDFKDSNEALRSLTSKLMYYLDKKNNEANFNLALSGGETAKQMFSIWVTEYKTKINWEKINFFWVDERCVPPGDRDSNYGNADKLLFKPLHIPTENIYRIHGETNPDAEAIRYSLIVEENLPQRDKLPYFDCIILGIGNDAHTASIFPDRLSLLTCQNLYAVSQQPITKQYRITMTGPLILNGSPLLVPALGSRKSNVIEDIEKGFSETNRTPAAYILSKAVDATVYTSLKD